MRAGNWASYQDYVDRNPDLFKDLNEPNYWEEFLSTYCEKYGDLDDDTYDKVKKIWKIYGDSPNGEDKLLDLKPVEMFIEYGEGGLDDD
jgi:hypothetical protein